MAYSSEIQFIIIMVEHGNTQADMVLEKKLRVLHLEMQATGSDLGHWVWLEHIQDIRHLYTVTHFLLQNLIYSNKVTALNSAIPFGNHFLSNH